MTSKTPSRAGESCGASETAGSTAPTEQATRHTTSARHSPLPWSISEPNEVREDNETTCGIEEADGWIVCDLWASATSGNNSPVLARANAEFIVRACNSHDDLLAALKHVVHCIDTCGSAEDCGNELLETSQPLRAALAKAEGRR